MTVDPDQALDRVLVLALVLALALALALDRIQAAPMETTTAGMAIP
jgi:hypothetical protein